MNARVFAEVAKGLFYSVATVGLCIVLYLVVVVWQPIWTEGFKDFGSIASAIRNLDRTAKPVAEMAPLMLGEMDEMRQSMQEIQVSMGRMEKLNPSMHEMNNRMGRLTWVLEHRMGAMTGEMDRMSDKFSPTGMMPFNW
jgi:hypothetical protein